MPRPRESEFYATFGQDLRQARTVAGRTLDEVARAVRDHYGLPWNDNLVGKLERGEKPLSLYEFALLVPALESIGIRMARVAPSAPQARQRATAGPGAAECKAAALFTVPAAAVVAASTELWGQTLTAEREQRLGNAEESPRSRQALRGHVTRTLLAELKNHLEARS